MVTIEKARQLAEKIKNKTELVLEIELFGSTLRNAQGHDIDLLLTVDENISNRFWRIVDKIGSSGPLPPLFIRRIIKLLAPSLDQVFKKNKMARQSCALQLINLDLESLDLQTNYDGTLDIWLVPYDWRVKIPELTQNKNIRKILRHAANYAIKI